MRYVRFMSQDELDKYKAGETLRNLTDWRKRSQVTSSVGFCFFDDAVKPEKRMEYLTGVVDLDCVAVFECIDGKMKAGGLTVRTDDPSQYLRELLSSYRSPRFDYLPSFTGGRVGRRAA